MSIKIIVPDLGPGNAKKAVPNVMQKNISSTILLGLTQGIGNIIMATPLIKALTSMNLSVDILDGGFLRGAERVLDNMMDVKIVTAEEAEKTIYLLGLQSFWPNPDIAKYVSQERAVSDILGCWERGIPAHEVDMNMALAYSLNYKGDIPSLYCNSNQIQDHTLGKPIRIGIHVCRSYTHQFYMNRRLLEPENIAREIVRQGFIPVIVGHRGCASPDGGFPIGTEYLTGLELADTAGVIESLDAMINEDSGIMHVTAAMNTPQVAIFGPTSDVKNMPWSSKAIVLKNELDCQPCQYAPRATTCTNNICMNISPELIVDKAKTLIEEFPKKGERQ